MSCALDESGSPVVRSGVCALPRVAVRRVVLAPPEFGVAPWWLDLVDLTSSELSKPSPIAAGAFLYVTLVSKKAI
jgi:hypothetical protein